MKLLDIFRKTHYYHAVMRSGQEILFTRLGEEKGKVREQSRHLTEIPKDKYEQLARAWRRGE